MIALFEFWFFKDKITTQKCWKSEKIHESDIFLPLIRNFMLNIFFKTFLPTLYLIYESLICHYQTEIWWLWLNPPASTVCGIRAGSELVYVLEDSGPWHNWFSVQFSFLDFIWIYPLMGLSFLFLRFRHSAGT